MQVTMFLIDFNLFGSCKFLGYVCKKNKTLGDNKIILNINLNGIFYTNLF